MKYKRRIGIGPSIGINSLMTSPSQDWTPLSISSKILFWGKYSDIADGKMPNILESDWLTVSGSVGSETYQCPNTTPYIAADTDYIWFKTNATQRTTTTAELISYDLPKTFIKYQDVSPYAIQEIAILKDGEMLSSDELNNVRDYFHLSIWWDGTLSFYGYVKTNRLIGKSSWVAEDVILELLSDGHTVAWYDSQDLTTITKDGSNLVTRWNDKLLSGHDLIRAAGTRTPVWSMNGILFDGVDDYMKTGTFVFEQPEFIYIVFKQITWSFNDKIFDGNVIGSGRFEQYNITPRLRLSAGTGSTPNDNLPLDTFCIARLLLDGASSKIIINETPPVVSNAGTNDMNGFTLGVNGDTFGGYSNIEVKEIILRNISDSTSDESTIYSYLKYKYSIV